MRFIVSERVGFLFKQISEKTFATVANIRESFFEITRVPRVRHVARMPLPHQIAATATAARVRQATGSGCLAISIFITPIVRLRKRSRARRDARMPPGRNAEPSTKIGKKVETRRPESVFLRLRRRRTLRPAGSPGRRPPRYVPAALRHRTVRTHGTAGGRIVPRSNA